MPFDTNVHIYICYSTNFKLMINYRSPTKLPEGNVFKGVCLSVDGDPNVTITHDALTLTV